MNRDEYKAAVKEALDQFKAFGGETYDLRKELTRLALAHIEYSERWYWTDTLPEHRLFAQYFIVDAMFEQIREAGLQGRLDFSIAHSAG